MAKTESCIDCDGVYINHSGSYASGIIGSIVKPIEKTLGALARNIDPLIMRALSPLAPVIFYTFEKLKWATISSSPSSEDSLRVKCLWAEAERRGIRMNGFHLFNQNMEWFIAEYKGKQIVFEGLPRPTGKPSKALDWMDDKAATRKKLKRAGIPIANGGVRWSLRSALKLFEKLEKPVITKPHMGSQARHTSVRLNTPEEFKRGFLSAKRLSPWIVIEEELKGTVFRGTLIDGRVVGVMRRDPPAVIGDGRRTIEELVTEENKNPGRYGGIFHPLILDAESDEYLNKMGLTRKSIPQKGDLVWIGEKFAKARGSSRTEVTEITHPENIKLLERIYEVVKDPIIGIDFIVEDISRPWQEQKRSGVIELNSLPFIDLHHYVLFGAPKNVAGALWDVVFPQSKTSQNETIKV